MKKYKIKRFIDTTKSTHEDELKYFEVNVILSQDNKSYLFVAPAKASAKVIEVINDIMRYLGEHDELDFVVNKLN